MVISPLVTPLVVVTSVAWHLGHSQTAGSHTRHYQLHIFTHRLPGNNRVSLNIRINLSPVRSRFKCSRHHEINVFIELFPSASRTSYASCYGFLGMSCNPAFALMAIFFFKLIGVLDEVLNNMNLQAGGIIDGSIFNVFIPSVVSG
ncbi:MAG: hypothetical protein HY016_02460 [Nitrosomonadales bacterium]|nr:hypothetical protein [Nitrosomonadales bacterium]